MAKNGRAGTSNVGIIRGGEATNVVTNEVLLHAEARSHDPAFRAEIVAAIERAFRLAAKSVRNVDGLAGKVEIHGRLDYEAFRLPADDPSVLAAGAAVRALGIEPQPTISNGGLDANWLTARGIPSVSLGGGVSGATPRTSGSGCRNFAMPAGLPCVWPRGRKLCRLRRAGHPGRRFGSACAALSRIPRPTRAPSGQG